MKVTKKVIMDLLPLYLANEVSEDTRALVEEYIKSDPEVAKMAKQATAEEILNDIPVPLSEEAKLKVYLEAKRLMFWRSVIITIVVTVGLFSLISLALLAARIWF
jgi:hypothetical protein